MLPGARPVTLVVVSHATYTYVVFGAIRVLRATPQVLRYHHSSGGYATKGHLWLVQPEEVMSIKEVL